MKIQKFMAFAILFASLAYSVAFAAGGPSKVPPDDYDPWCDSYFGLRDTIGYGDIESDPGAHGLTVYGVSEAAATESPSVYDDIESVYDDIEDDTSSSEFPIRSIVLLTLFALLGIGAMCSDLVFIKIERKNKC